MKNLFKWINLVFVLFIILGKVFWDDVNFLFISSLISANLIYYCVKRERIKISIISVVFLVLIVYEGLNVLYSMYYLNSFLGFCDLLGALGIVIILFLLLQQQSVKWIVAVVSSLMALLFSVWGILYWILTNMKISYFGFEDFSQFRYFYGPLGIISNDWVTLLLCLIVIVTYILVDVLSGNKIQIKSFKVIFPFLTILLLIINLVLTYSRAGYLALFSFVFVVSVILFINKLFSKKIVFFVISVCLAVSIASLFNQKSFFTTMRGSESHARSIEGRYKQWNEIKDYSIVGVGGRNFALCNMSKKDYDIERTFTGRTNNTLLQIVIEKGFLGLLIYAVLIILFFYYSFWYSKRTDVQWGKIQNTVALSGIIAIGVREMFFSSIFYNNGVLVLFLVILMFNLNRVKTFQMSKCMSSLLYLLGLVLMFFLAKTYYVETKANDYYKQYVENFDKSNLNEAENYILKAIDYQSNNHLYNSSLVLCKINDMLDTTITSLNDDEDFIHKNKVKIHDPEELLRILLHSYTDNLYDDFLAFNISWLYKFCGQRELALDFIDRAIRQNPNISLYYITKGFFLEKRNVESAFVEYEKAFMLSMDILDAPFFLNLKQKYPIETKKMLDSMLQALSLINVDRDSPILKVKLARLLIELDQCDKAFVYLKDVTRDMPNLNRAWYYLGTLYEWKQDYIEMERCFRISSFLDIHDYMPLLGLANFYKHNNDNQYRNYYIKAIKSYEKKRSFHSERGERLYNVPLVRNDLIPGMLLELIKPQCNLK